METRTDELDYDDLVEILDSYTPELELPKIKIGTPLTVTDDGKIVPCKPGDIPYGVAVEIREDGVVEIQSSNGGYWTQRRIE